MFLEREDVEKPFLPGGFFAKFLRKRTIVKRFSLPKDFLTMFLSKGTVLKVSFSTEKFSQKVSWERDRGKTFF